MPNHFYIRYTLALNLRKISSKMKKNRVLLILFLISQGALADKIMPFKSDGCSAFPDGTIDQNDLWFKCCYQHDIAYWKGGTYQQRMDADKELKQCVANVGEPIIAQLMLAGVRVGGSPFFPTNFRWGYGWPYMRGYQPLSDEETIEIDILLEIIESEK